MALTLSGFFPKVIFSWASSGVSSGLPIGCGFAVNAAARLRPRLVDGSLTVEISGLRAGWLPLPDRLAEKLAARMIEKAAQTLEYQMTMQIVKRATLQEDGTLVVTFVPARISALLALLITKP